MTITRCAALLLLLTGLAASAEAQTYPDRPIKVIVPISVGSITDLATRVVAQELQARLGQPVVVLNKPGASMALGGAECAKSEHDGYTLCVVSPDTMSFNPLLVPNLPYDPDKDFTPVIDLYHVVEGLIASQGSGLDTIDAFHAKAVAAPGKLNYGTLGERTTTDAFRQWLAEHWKTKLTAIPYKGGGEIAPALLGNTIDVTKIGVGNMTSLLNDGKIKVLALSATHRAPQLPNVPTFGEAGLGGYPGGPIFWGLVVPAGTPAPIVARLHDELLAILRGPQFTAFAERNFLEQVAGSAADFAAFLKKDRQDAAALVNTYMK
jgi:tripartite-type tricarboxylate transporter receptor subunit TctC